MTNKYRTSNKELRMLKLLVIAKDAMSEANTSSGNLPLKGISLDQGDHFVVIKLANSKDKASS